MKLYIHEFGFRALWLDVLWHLVSRCTLWQQLDVLCDLVSGGHEGQRAAQEATAGHQAGVDEETPLELLNKTQKLIKHEWYTNKSYRTNVSCSFITDVLEQHSEAMQNEYKGNWYLL